MELATAIRSAAPRAPAEAIDGLESVKDQAEQLGALDTPAPPLGLEKNSRG